MQSSTIGRVIRFSMAALAISLAYWFKLRPWHLRWGATDTEVSSVLPGDDLALSAELDSTHAITIRAPADAIWPWLVQIGQDKAGFYSYSKLENLVGCRIHNADRIVAEWQNLAVGAPVWLHPSAPPLHVLAIEHGRAIVLEKCWTFVLLPIDEHNTRLIVRGRGKFNPNLGNPILNFLCWRVLYEPIHFVMERKMLLGIKQRAEAVTPANLHPSTLDR